MTFVGVHGRFGQNGPKYVVTDEIVRPHRTNPDKVAYLLQLQFLEDNHREYLWGYHTKGLAGTEAAESLDNLASIHLIALAEDLEEIIREASRRGWLFRWGIPAS